MKKSIFTIFLLLCSIACSELFAQTVIQQDSTYIFEMKDGNTYIGKVNILEKGRMYELSTSIGKLSIRAEDIEVVRIADKNNIRTGTYWPKNPHSSRYFFSPSGYGLRKGEGYYPVSYTHLDVYKRQVFDHNKQKAVSYNGKSRKTAQKKVIPFEQCTHDLLSVLYFMRNV